MLKHDLRAMGHGSADYCHLLIECIKLAYADREQYYGDPAQTLVPGEVLLSDSRITSYNVCYTKLLRTPASPTSKRKPSRPFWEEKPLRTEPSC